MNRILVGIFIVLLMVVFLEVGFYWSITNKTGTRENSSPSPTSSLKTLYEGTFAAWEKIEGSSDRYLLLEDSQTKKREVFRVWFTPYPVSAKRKATTQVAAIDDLERVKKEDNWQEKAITLGAAQELEATLSALVKKDETIIVFPLTDKGKEYLKDEAGRLMASWLIIRQFDSKKVRE